MSLFFEAHKVSRGRTNVIVLSLLTIAAFATTASAQEESFSVTYSVGGTANGVDFGEKHKAYTLDFILIARNDADKGFLHNMSAKCIAMAFVDPKDGTKGGGFCSFTDEDGDKLFERWDYTTPEAGTIEFIDGTGKYAGFTCKGNWKRVARLKPAAKGTWQVIGRKTGTCKMP